MKKSQLRKIIRESINSMGIEPTGYYTDQGHKTEENPKDIEYWLKQIEGMSLGDARDYLGIEVGLPSSMTHKVLQQHNTDIVDTFDDFSDEENPFPSSRKGIDQLDKDDLYENTIKRSELKKLIKESYLKSLKEEDEEDIEDIEDDFDSAEPAVAQDGESKNQESAPRKRINFENRELEMLVDVNKNATKKGIKIQFLSDDELSKEERTKLVSSLQTYLDEGLAKFVKGAKLNIDSDPDVPNKTKTVGFTIKIGDVFGLVSKVFANRGDDEEEGGEVDFEAEETEETEELQELRRQIRGFLKEEQMEMSFKTFEDVKNDMSEFPGFQEIAGGFSLPIEGIMGDALGGSYEFTENPDQTVKVTKVDGEGNELSSKSHPIDTIVGFLEKY